MRRIIGYGLILLSFGCLFSLDLQAQDRPKDAYRLGPSLEELEEATPPVKEQPTIRFDQGEWNQMRHTIEEGREPGVDISTGVAVSTRTVEAPKPPPGQIRVELPYESSLSVTGRKVIRVEIENTHITNERAEELGTKQDTQSFKMEQELQARIQGTVARKTTINVNFDDTKENVRDFSVVYQGDPDEVVQEAAFGDITLSLPSTEFVNYNKQLFGIRTALKYKKAGLMAIGSKTKGTTETKRFVGTTTRNQVFINDTNYIRRRFYDVTFATAAFGSMYNSTGPLNGHTVLPIRTDPEIVYIEDTTGLLQPPVAQDFEIATPTAPWTSTLIRMRQASPGVDYSFDRDRGILTFTNQIVEDVRVAIDYTLNDGTRLSSLVQGGVAVLIKDNRSENPGVSQEIKRFYFVGSRNIVPDNGLGNFVFKVLDQRRENEIGTNPDLFVPPLDKSGIDMKFETGVFELRRTLPFSEVYAINASNANPQRAVFSLEFQSILRTFTLRPNIVLQSEVVTIDGRRVNRDLDYFIDYDIGIITFFNDDLIRESTTIEVTYEFAPFGGQLGETLVGARGTYDILSNKRIGGVAMESWNAGSTVLYNFAAKPTGPPDIRSTPSSLLVTEGDTNLKGVQVGNIPIKTNFAVESARSSENPNLFGKALIDSFEGLKQEDAASLLEDSWRIASNPVVAGSSVTDFRGRENPDSHIRWSDVDVVTLDPNDGDANQKALLVGYNLTANQEQASIINVLSFSGRDFSKKTTLELEIQGAGSLAAGEDVDLIVDYGSFNEDADGDGVLDTEDETLDGVLNLGEDDGWVYNGIGSNNIRVGPSNTRLDTEDLNNDRQFSRSDTPATFQPLFVLSSTHTGTVGGTTVTGVKDLSFGDRLLFQIPLNVKALTATEQNNLAAVRQVRVTLRNKGAANKAGSIIIARLSVVGISWEPATVTVPGSTMTVRAINNKDDAGTYIPVIGHPDFNDLYKDATPTGDAKEQALALDYFLLQGSTATTVNKYGAVRDFSRHDEFKFFLRRRDGVGDNDAGTFFLQAGGETEYQEIEIPVSAIPGNAWMVVNILQDDVNSDGIPETWTSNNPNITITRVGGQPSLSQISQLRAGVRNGPGVDAQNQIWVNEIHVSKPHERIGNAKRYTMDSTWPNWMDFGAGYREVDRHWQTPTTAVTNQDREEETAYLNFNRIKVLPMTWRTTRDFTATPSAFRSNANALVSVLEEGRVERVTNAYTANLLVPKLPILNFTYNNEDSENNLTQRSERVDAWRVGASYSPLSKPDLLPGGRFNFRPLPTSITLGYANRTSKLRYPELDRLINFGISTAPFSSTDLTQFSEESEARLAFNPWNGFNFNPTYRLKVDTEKRFFREDETAAVSTLSELEGQTTPRQMAQNITASGNLKLLKWFDPRYSYSFNGTETNGLPTLSNTTNYLVKTITRNSFGELTGAVQAAQVIPGNRLVQSMNVNSSYKVENGDAYADVPNDFKWRDQLWVGTPLKISSGTSARRIEATDRRTFRTNLSWLPFSGYTFSGERIKPLSSISLTSNYLTSTEDTETTGTTKRVESVTFPDLIMTINEIEDFFGVKRVVDESRLTLKTNKRKTETLNISKSVADSYGTDYQFKFRKKYEVSTSVSITKAREDNLVIDILTSKTDTLGYSVQTRIPAGSWAYTPRYQYNKTDSRDSLRTTNDLVTNTYALQIYGDITKPLGLRFGRKEIGLANRFILNGNLQWDKKRSSVNPSTNYLDLYAANLSGDYTLSKNFRLALTGRYSQEVHHPDFSKLDQSTFGIGSTLTIQF